MVGEPNRAHPRGITAVSPDTAECIVLSLGPCRPP
jgi:hypothetical protein